MCIKSEVTHHFRKEVAMRFMILKIWWMLDKSLEVHLIFSFYTWNTTILGNKHFIEAMHFSGCSYYAARSIADDAQLVFCPYSYIINPVIRGAMEVDIKGAILILDEAQYVSQLLFTYFPINFY